MMPTLREAPSAAAAPTTAPVDPALRVAGAASLRGKCRKFQRMSAPLAARKAASRDWRTERLAAIQAIHGAEGRQALQIQQPNVAAARGTPVAPGTRRGTAGGHNSAVRGTS